MKKMLRLSWFSATMLMLGACGSDTNNILNGYVETQPIRLASPIAGRLQKTVHEGQILNADQLAFTLDTESEQLALAESDARAQTAKAQYQDLLSGKRPEELGMYEATLRVAEANLRASEAELKRQSELKASGFVSQSTLDVLKARRDADAAQVAQAQSQLAAARLAGREQTIIAASSNADAATQAVAQKRWVLQQKSITSPVSGRIEQVYYRTGEWVPAGSPVLSIIDNAAIKVRFFIPQARIPAFSQGNRVYLRCDGCNNPIPATISFVAKEAEFTPPVMYNNDNRSKLVWMAEARPDPAYVAELHPGQPVDVEVAP